MYKCTHCCQYTVISLVKQSLKKIIATLSENNSINVSKKLCCVAFALKCVEIYVINTLLTIICFLFERSLFRRRVNTTPQLIYNAHKNCAGNATAHRSI